MLTGAITLGGAVNRACPLNRGLVSWWLNTPSRRSGSRFIDIAGNNNGTLTAGPTWQGAMGRPGGLGSLNFDGVDDYVTVPASDTSGLILALKGNGGISLWAKRLSGTGVKGMFNLKDVGNNFLICYWGNTYNGFNLQRSLLAAERGVQPISAIVETEWNHIAITWISDGTVVPVCYVNGKDVSSSILQGFGEAAANVFEIGRGASGFNAHSLMDDIRIWNRALSANEVKDVYNDSRTGYTRTLNRVQRRLVSPAAAAGNRRRRVICGASV